MARRRLIEFREGTAAQWATANPVLALGEPGWDSTNGIIKIGDGVTPWNTLPNAGAGGVTSPTTAWVTPGLGAKWANEGPPYQVARYRKWLGLVIVQGLVISTAAVTAADVIFTLPAEFIPDVNGTLDAAPFSVSTGEIGQAGEVRINNSAPINTFVALNFVYPPRGA